MLRPKLNRIWTSANSVLRRDPGDAKYIQGWVSEIPTFQVLNFLQYKVDTALLAQAERGIFEWGSDITYGLGSVVWCENDKKIYVSTVGAPDKTKAPNTNLAHWSPSSIQVPRASYDAILAAINSHIANKSNPHNLSAAQLGSYTKAETDALVAQYQALVLAHSSNKNNPHGVTALQVGAVPATGGNYTGDVIFNGGMFFDAGKVNQISKTGGLFLQAGTAVLGINSSGVAVAGTVASNSPLVTEAAFPALKALREPLYAVPEPMVMLDLLGNVNLKAGVGTTLATGFSTGDVPTYDASQGGAIDFFGAALSVIRQQDSKYQLTGECTVAIDILCKNASVAGSGSAATFGVESPNSMLIQMRPDNRFFALRSSAAGTKYTGIIEVPLFQWTRLVATFSPTELRIYKDGVLASSLLDDTTASASASRFVIYRSNNSAISRDFCLRNFRIWNSALTAEQVSTL